jgi:hypothetical protein
MQTKYARWHISYGIRLRAFAEEILIVLLLVIVLATFDQD